MRGAGGTGGRRSRGRGADRSPQGGSSPGLVGLAPPAASRLIPFPRPPPAAVHLAQPDEQVLRDLPPHAHVHHLARLVQAVAVRVAAQPPGLHPRGGQHRGDAHHQAPACGAGGGQARERTDQPASPVEAVRKAGRRDGRPGAAPSKAPSPRRSKPARAAQAAQAAWAGQTGCSSHSCRQGAHLCDAAASWGSAGGAARAAGLGRTLESEPRWQGC